MTSLGHFIVSTDWWLFHGLNSIAGKNAALDGFFRIGADDHIVPIILSLLTLLVLLLARNLDERDSSWRCLVCAIIAVALSAVILLALNSLFFRTRPFTGHEVTLLLYHNTDSAFPSNAATLAFSLAIAVTLYRRRLGVVMLCLAAFLGLSRIVAGVHYPSDMIAGALLGLASAFLARALEPAYRPLTRRLTKTQYRLLASLGRPPRGSMEVGAR